MDRIDYLSEDRHAIVHGVPQSIASADGVFEFRRLRAGKTMHSLESSGFDLKQFPVFSKALENLVNDMNDFSQDLAEEFLPENEQHRQ